MFKIAKDLLEKIIVNLNNNSLQPCLALMSYYCNHSCEGSCYGGCYGTCADDGCGNGCHSLCSHTND